MNIHQAVKELRTRLGQSQQVFATDLDLSIRAIVNYENDRVPGARPLAQLERCALEQDHCDLAEIFNAALASELKLARTKRTPLTPHEYWLQSAFERCVFENPDSPGAKRIRKTLEPYLEQLRKEDVSAHRELARIAAHTKGSGEKGLTNVPQRSRADDPSVLSKSNRSKILSKKVGK